MKKIITIGGATQDIFITYKEQESLELPQKDNKSYIILEEGHKFEVTDLHYAPGGGATNTAMTFHKLGLDVQPMCKTSADAAGNFIIQMLHKAGINTSLIKQNAQHQTGTSFILPTPTGNRTILAYRGANEELELDDIPSSLFKSIDYVYISSLAKKSSHIFSAVCAQAQQNNCFVATNPGLHQLKSADTVDALQYIDLFTLNMFEAQTFAKALKINGDLTEYFKTIHAHGPKIAIVTDGANGVHVSTQDSSTATPSTAQTQECFYPSIPVASPVNTVGAGDAFTSCFVGMLALGHDIPTAIQAGLHNSASVLRHNDAQTGILSYAELKKLMGQSTAL